jgi:hypothetical protein
MEIFENLPWVIWKTAKAKNAEDPYQPTWLILLNSAVMGGIAMARIVESRLKASEQVQHVVGRAPGAEEAASYPSCSSTNAQFPNLPGDNNTSFFGSAGSNSSAQSASPLD